MGSYTTGLYKFFKPGSGDFVDPELDMENNFDILDDKVYHALNWNAPTLSPLSLAGNVLGAKAVDPKTNFTYVWNGSTWVLFSSLNNNEPWNNLTLNSDYFSGTGSNINGRAAWRYTNSAHDHVELKGTIFKLTAIPNNTSITLCNAGSVPSPNAGNSRYFNIPPGIGTSNPNNNNASRIQISTTGAIVATHYGTSVAGDINNYFSFDPIRYPV